MITEAQLEDSILDWLGDLGWEPAMDAELESQRESLGDLVLREDLMLALRNLNPSVPDQHLHEAAANMLQVRSQDPLAENRDFHEFLVHGYRGLNYLDAAGREENPTVRLLGEVEQNSYAAYALPRPAAQGGPAHADAGPRQSHLPRQARRAARRLCAAGREPQQGAAGVHRHRPGHASCRQGRQGGRAGRSRAHRGAAQPARRLRLARRAGLPRQGRRAQGREHGGGVSAHARQPGRRGRGRDQRAPPRAVEQAGVHVDAGRGLGEARPSGWRGALLQGSAHVDGQA